jgi:hypothetical protein
VLELLRRSYKARVAKVTRLQHGEHLFGFVDECLHGLVGVQVRVGAMLFQDRLRSFSLPDRLFLMRFKASTQRGVRCRLCHMLESVPKLLFDADELLQLGNVHVLEGGDLHGGNVPFWMVLDGRGSCKAVTPAITQGYLGAPPCGRAKLRGFRNNPGLGVFLRGRRALTAPGISGASL